MRLIHEGGEHFMRRAMHFARRELSDQRRPYPVSAMGLAFVLLYRAGINLQEIALIEEERREKQLPALMAKGEISPAEAARWAACDRSDVSRHIRATLAVLETEAARAWLEGLVEEMGRARWRDVEAEIITFPRRAA